MASGLEALICFQDIGFENLDLFSGKLLRQVVDEMECSEESKTILTRRKDLS